MLLLIPDVVVLGHPTIFPRTTRASPNTLGFLRSISHLHTVLNMLGKSSGPGSQWYSVPMRRGLFPDTDKGTFSWALPSNQNS